MFATVILDLILSHGLCFWITPILLFVDRLTSASPGFFLFLFHILDLNLSHPVLRDRRKFPTHHILILCSVRCAETDRTLLTAF